PAGATVTGANAAPETGAAAGTDTEAAETLSLSEALERHERHLIADALAAAGGNVAEAARRLQTDRPNLYRRMRRLGLGGATDG
ncbi:helix-turn-helix domain-containing protein, partial [Arthrospira platensis SPKY1]|nr:helix-turn-helix domain-containing protein [Arthrospira platensis SPKY1]